MATPADEAVLIKLMGSLAWIDTGDELISWVRKELHPVLSHGAFICGMGRIHSEGVSPVKVYVSNFPLDYLRSLKQETGLYFSSAITRWLATGEVQLLDVGSGEASGFDPVWFARFRASGLQNLAAHGVYDFTRQHASYFSFHQIPETLGERHRFMLQLLVPHMHAALLRILHKIRADKHAAGTNRALTARELEVLTWVCEGKTSTEIAIILGIAHSTVRNQIQSILVKLRVNTRAQAAAKAIKKGLVISRNPDSQFGSY